MGGYAGKMAFVDLASGSIMRESLPGKIYRSLLARVGLGARVLFERMEPKADPLGPDSVLGLYPVCWMGPPSPMASQYMVVTKSPLTHTWGDSNWIPALRLRGDKFTLYLIRGGDDNPHYHCKPR